MLAFAKDISQKDHQHPDESNNEKLKSYMDYQRGLNHEKLIYHSLDHAKTYLQKTINDAQGEESPVKDYIEKAFPVSGRYADTNTLMLMLRKLINAHNTTNNWFRMNPFFAGVVYDALDRYVQIYNRLVVEAPEKAEHLGLSKNGEKIDFDDWVRLYFHDLDFMIGQPMKYVHFTFRQRNQAISDFIREQRSSGKSEKEAIQEAVMEFNIEPATEKILLGEQAGDKDMELFFTSAENPIYQFLYDVNAEEGFLDGEALIDHSYLLAHQLKGLSESEANSVLSEIEKLSKH